MKNLQTGAGEEVVDRGDPRGSLTGARGVSSKEKGRNEGRRWKGWVLATKHSDGGKDVEEALSSSDP